jgi:hypothetical protein
MGAALPADRLRSRSASKMYHTMFDSDPEMCGFEHCSGGLCAPKAIGFNRLGGHRTLLQCGIRRAITKP